MLTAAIATAVSRMISKPLYQTLADRYTPPPSKNDPSAVAGADGGGGNDGGMRI
jgi:hypothetical protein